MKKWINSDFHKNWLRSQASNLFDFFQFSTINPTGGFYELGTQGEVVGHTRELHATTRMVHCFSIGHLLGRPGSADLIDHGMSYLWKVHRDQKHGGYVWSIDDGGIKDSSKQAYGHAFVLLAAASAKCVGHPLADKMLADVTEVLEARFWDKTVGAQKEEFAANWSSISNYRGQNSNMHFTESLMAAFEVTGENIYLQKAESIASLIIGKHASALGYRVAEHFDENWNVDLNYEGSSVFRPAGTTPGHALEWARLLLQLWELGGQKLSWLPNAAEQLFRAAIEHGWDHERGGFYYTLDWDNKPALTQKLWWPASEGIGAAAFLAAHNADPYFSDWYSRIWDFSNMHFIDHENGGWHPELGEDLNPAQKFFNGKPDIYHALQACLIPLYPAKGSLTKMIKISAQ